MTATVGAEIPQEYAGEWVRVDSESEVRPGTLIRGPAAGIGGDLIAHVMEPSEYERAPDVRVLATVVHVVEPTLSGEHIDRRGGIRQAADGQRYAYFFNKSEISALTPSEWETIDQADLQVGMYVRGAWTTDASDIEEGTISNLTSSSVFLDPRSRSAGSFDRLNRIWSIRAGSQTSEGRWESIESGDIQVGMRVRGALTSRPNRVREGIVANIDAAFVYFVPGSSNDGAGSARRQARQWSVWVEGSVLEESVPEWQPISAENIRAGMYVRGAHREDASNVREGVVQAIHGNAHHPYSNGPYIELPGYSARATSGSLRRWEVRSDTFETVSTPPSQNNNTQLPQWARDLTTLDDAKRWIHDRVKRAYASERSELPGFCGSGANDFLSSLGLPTVDEEFPEPAPETDAIRDFVRRVRQVLIATGRSHSHNVDAYLRELGFAPKETRRLSVPEGTDMARVLDVLRANGFEDVDLDR